MSEKKTQKSVRHKMMFFCNKNMFLAFSLVKTYSFEKRQFSINKRHLSREKKFTYKIKKLKKFLLQYKHFHTENNVLFIACLIRHIYHTFSGILY